MHGHCTLPGQLHNLAKYQLQQIIAKPVVLARVCWPERRILCLANSSRCCSRPGGHSGRQALAQSRDVRCTQQNWNKEVTTTRRFVVWQGITRLLSQTLIVAV
jgi:hypothetical protein